MTPSARLRNSRRHKLIHPRDLPSRKPYARAYAAGQADMRERAVSLVEEFNGERFTPHKDFLVDETIIGAWKNGIDDCALWAANDLRALPITPEPKETRLN